MAPSWNEDPFLWALAAGSPHGTLVSLGSSDGIPVLGPAAWKSRQGGMSDREIRQALQAQAGGSFSKFFSRLFGEPGQEDALEGVGHAERNPFSRAREELADKAAEAAAAEAPAERAEEEVQPAPPKESKPETKGAVPDAASTAAAAPAGPKPFLMLRVSDQGALEPLSATQTPGGYFEAQDAGISDFNLISFMDAPEFPTAIAVADFNGDRINDFALHQGPAGQLRFFLGLQDGSYQESFRIEGGSGPRSLAVGDFNRDGIADIAISPVGTGILTILLSNAGGPFRYQSYWLDAYRDYIIAADTSARGNPDVVGMTYGNRATVLVDFTSPEGVTASRAFDFSPQLSHQLLSSQGLQARMSAVVISSSLALNMENRIRQMINVLNVAAGSRVYVIAGDLDKSGRMGVGIATPKPRR